MVWCCVICNKLWWKIPTELEWEVCAKSGNPEHIFPWGNIQPNITLANYANLIGNTTEVDKYSPNLWGLYDMAGNLREWCADKYHPQYPFYLNSPYFEYIDSEYRVVKGGAWDKTSIHLKCSHRSGKWWRIGTAGIGFRVVFDKSDSDKGLIWW